MLASAASNVAVDNMAERLLGGEAGGKPLRVVRVGHPARLPPSAPSVKTGPSRLRL